MDVLLDLLANKSLPIDGSTAASKRLHKRNHYRVLLQNLAAALGYRFEIPFLGQRRRRQRRRKMANQYQTIVPSFLHQFVLPLIHRLSIQIPILPRLIEYIKTNHCRRQQLLLQLVRKRHEMDVRRNKHVVYRVCESSHVDKDNNLKSA